MLIINLLPYLFCTKCDEDSQKRPILCHAAVSRPAGGTKSAIFVARGGLSRRRRLPQTLPALESSRKNVIFVN